MRTLDIKELTKKESQNFGKFKIERKETKSKWGDDDGDVIEHTIVDYLYMLEEDEWKNIMYHTIYRYEVEFEHGKRYESGNKPLIPMIYVDIENQFYYVENEESTQYFSMDKYNWYRYLTRSENRPYYKRVDKLRKFKIPNI